MTQRHRLLFLLLLAPLALPAQEQAPLPAWQETLDEGKDLLQEGKPSEAVKAFRQADKSSRKRIVPDFELATLQGEYLTAEDLKGKVILLDFWGTWCAPCVAAVPSLRTLSRRMKDDPFVLLSISTDQDEAVLREFITRNKMDWPQVWDKDHDFSEECQISRYPSYLLVSHEGEIVYLTSGWGEGIERDLLQKVAGAVRAAKKSAKAKL